MDLHDLADVTSAHGPFVTGAVASESAVEQPAGADHRAWRAALQELRGRGVGDVEDVVAALRQAQAQAQAITTDAAVAPTLFSGPEPAQLATRASELTDLGVTDVQEGPVVDVLLRAALGTGADVEQVPHELTTAPAGGVGAVLRHADSLGTSAEAHQDEVQQ